MSGKIQVEAKIVEHGKGKYVINYGAYYQSESDDCTSIEKSTHFTFVAATNYLEQSYPKNSVWNGHWQDRNGERACISSMPASKFFGVNEMVELHEENKPTCFGCYGYRVCVDKTKLPSTCQWEERCYNSQRDS